MDKTIIKNSRGVEKFRPRKPPAPEVFSEIIRKKARASEENAGSADMSGWNIGFASRCGNIRKRNEDYGIAFNHLGHQIMILGDGLGGLNYGQLASFLAVESATQVVLERLVKQMGVNDILQISSDAFWSASHQLAFMGDKLNVSMSGLRTTLIMIIANSSQAALTYIGDGAVYHYKGPGDCQSVLSAHKANQGSLNLLSASLGPVPQGQARSRIMKRTKYDILVLMTDGIADRIDRTEDSTKAPQFIKDVITRADDLDGNLQIVAEEAVDALTELKDESDFICDDNVSLGIIGNLHKPELAVIAASSVNIIAGVPENADPA